ncbi:MAG: hypothetical protein COB08_007380 [Rhodobacteraceae bacterium]|nr:hypothetical protein [Paracoccaceae bacterium]
MELPNAESSNDYLRICFEYGRFRIIESNDNWQWVIQKRGAKGMAAARWRSISYCRTRKALVARWTALQCTTGRVEWPELAYLPALFSGVG